MTQLTRPRVAALEELIGTELPVLDRGFVRLIDYMGDDGAVVQAARVSYGTGTKQVQDDRGLIRYLMRHAHTTPFEMCEIKFHIRAPMDVWRQWIRHRTANVNEYSTRYSVAIDAAHRTEANEWRLQSGKNKQGSEGFLPESEGRRLSQAEAEIQTAARTVYEERLAMGVAREQARKDLPLATYTEAYWKIDLHNLLHFLKLRMDAHAQREICRYAVVIGEQVVSRWVPTVWEAFLDFEHHDLHLSRIEREVIVAMIAGSAERARAIAESGGILSRRPDGGLARNREREELETKLRNFGLAAPWL